MDFQPDLRTIGLLAVVAALAATAGSAVVGAVRRPQLERGVDPRGREARGVQAAFVLVASTWFLLVFGSAVRVNGAGLACPDWPACFGRVVPELDWKVSLEVFHRYYAGFDSAVYLGVSGLLLSSPKLRRAVAPWVVAAGLALTGQIVLGGLTVLHLLDEWTVASHLLCGNAFAVLLLQLALAAREGLMPSSRPTVTPIQRGAATALAALLPIQLALGGLVASSEAGLACGTWPTCDGHSVVPTLSGVVGLQVVHRLAAYAVGAAALAAVAATRGRGALGRPALLAFGLVVVQIALGVTNVFLHLPVEVTLLHSAGAAAIVLATGWLVAEAWRAPLAVTADEPALSLREAK